MLTLSPDSVRQILLETFARVAKISMYGRPSCPAGPLNGRNGLAATNVAGGTAAVVLLGSAVAGTIAGHPIYYLKDAYKEVERDGAKFIEWVSGWF